MNTTELVQKNAQYCYQGSSGCIPIEWKSPLSNVLTGIGDFSCKVGDYICTREENSWSIPRKIQCVITPEEGVLQALADQSSYVYESLKKSMWTGPIAFFTKVGERVNWEINIAPLKEVDKDLKKGKFDILRYAGAFKQYKDFLLHETDSTRTLYDQHLSSFWGDENRYPRILGSCIKDTVKPIRFERVSNESIITRNSDALQILAIGTVITAIACCALRKCKYKQI
jgi:hypothetical protein